MSPLDVLDGWEDGVPLLNFPVSVGHPGGVVGVFCLNNLIVKIVILNAGFCLIEVAQYSLCLPLSSGGIKRSA